MKKWLLLFFPLVMAMQSCREEPPFIDMNPVVDTTLVDTTYITAQTVTPQQKVVLLEDFTGVRCVNCPTAQARAKQIAAANPGRVVLTALHVTAFAVPHNNSVHDFRTAQGSSIVAMLGEPAGLPMGAIDRVLFAGETTILVGFNKWEALVQQQLQQTTPVNLELYREYDEATRSLFVRATVTYSENVSENNYLSLQLLESKIIDYQTTPQGIVDNYEHNHTLRTMLTPYNGVQLNASLEKGRVFVKEFRIAVPENWVADNMEIVGFVHERINTFRVHQSQMISLK